MKVQSLSIHVPTKGCVNHCPMCVSRMHKSPYENRIDRFIYHGDARGEYVRRLNFAKNNGVNTVILTGEGEALQNIEFINWFFNSPETPKFEWVELQTSGNFLDVETLKKLKRWGVSTISLSVMNIFDSENNSKLIGKIESLETLCKRIKDLNLNLRLSLNIWNEYSKHTIEDVFNRSDELGADQITFRKLYHSPEENTKQDLWIKKNTDKLFIETDLKDNFFENSIDYFKSLEKYITKNGHFIGRLPFGALKYSINGISTVVDNNCMSEMEEEMDVYKYLILRPNCKLYTDWSDKGSLLF